METTDLQQPIEQQPVTPEPVVPDPAATEPAPDPAAAAIAGLGAKIDQLLETRTQEPATSPMDFLDELEQEPEQQGIQPQQEYQEPGLDPEAQAQLADLERLIDYRAGQMVAPILQEQRETQIRALEQKYPEMRDPEVRAPLIQKMREVRDRSGNDAVLSDPVMIEMALLAVKAETAGTAAVPAEPAVEPGASLETNAGQSQAGSPSNERDDYIHTMLSTKADRSVFG